MAVGLPCRWQPNLVAVQVARSQFQGAAGVVLLSDDELFGGFGLGSGAGDGGDGGGGGGLELGLGLGLGLTTVEL